LCCFPRCRDVEDGQHSPLGGSQHSAVGEEPKEGRRGLREGLAASYLSRLAAEDEAMGADEAPCGSAPSPVPAGSKGWAWDVRDVALVAHPGDGERLHERLAEAQARIWELESVVEGSARELEQLRAAVAAKEQEVASARLALRALEERVAGMRATGELRPPSTPEGTLRGTLGEWGLHSAGGEGDRGVGGGERDEASVWGENQRLRLEVGGLRCCCEELQAAAKQHCSAMADMSDSVVQVGLVGVVGGLPKC